MAGYVVVKIRCKQCLKRVADGGAEKCQCKNPQPERIEMRVMTPVKREHIPVREAVACAS